MKRSYWYALALILILSLLVRTYPLFNYSLWGMDAGEYVYYTQRWVERGSMYRSIDGWAQAYPFFPGLFALSGSFHILTDVGVYHSVNFVPVILSSFVPLVAFLLAYRITLSKKASLLASAFLTLIVPFVYSYSQPKPETLGFFLLIFILLLSFMVTKKNHVKILCLSVPFFAALIVTHHLSSFFIMLFLLGGFFFAELMNTRWRWENKIRILLFLVFSTGTILYWYYGAPVFRDERLLDVMGLPSYSIVLSPYVMALLGYLVIKVRRRSSWRPDIDLRWQNKDRQMMIGILPAVIGFIMIVYSAFFHIPGTNIRLGSSVLLYSPFLLFGVFTVFSGNLLRVIREGTTLTGWILGISGTFMIGALTGFSSLYTVRQVAFFMLPISILFGLGLVWFQNMMDPFSKKKRIIAIVVVLILALNIPLMYPGQDTTGGYVEWTEYDNIEASFWARDSLPNKILTDQRLSAAVFSTGETDTTWTDGEPAYFSKTVDEAKIEVEDLGARYFMMDRYLIDGAMVETGTNPRPVEEVLLEWYRDGHLLYQGESTKIYLIQNS